MFAAGVQTVAMYGCEHFEMDSAVVKKLRAQLIRSGSVRPFSVPHEITILAHKIEQDPGFTSVAQPVLRWAREIWIASTEMHKRPGDALNFTELEQTAERIY